MSPSVLIVIAGAGAALLYYMLVILRTKQRTEFGPIARVDLESKSIELTRFGAQLKCLDIEAIEIARLVLHDSATNKTVTNKKVHVVQRWTQLAIIQRTRDNDARRVVVCTVRFGGRRLRRAAKRIASELRVPINQTFNRHRIDTES